jgi:aminopeptidase N
MMKVRKSLILCLITVITFACATSYDDEDLESLISIIAKPTFDSAYRLPNNTVPLRYDLWLKTDFDKRSLDFEGRVRILVKTVVPTNKITLLMRDLHIDEIDLLAADGTLKQSKLRSQYVGEIFFLNIFLPDQTKQNDELVLDVKYHGKMSKRNEGLCYFGDYKGVVSRLEPFYARRVFPCFDEPQILSVINLRIQHNKRFDGGERKAKNT